MRPVCVFAKGPGEEIERLPADLRGRWRLAMRAVMVVLSLQGLPAAQVVGLLECHPATVRRWIARFNAEGLAGLADRPRCGQPPPGGRRLAWRIAALLERPGPWTLRRIWGYPGPAAGQHAHAVPAGAAGGSVAAAQADRPRRPRSRPRGGRYRGPAAGAAAPGGGVRRGRDPSEPAGARAGQLDVARRPPADPDPGQEPAGHRARRAGADHRALGVPGWAAVTRPTSSPCCACSPTPSPAPRRSW
jgi:hypothetical protein